jgi:4-amino-4-deoxy-L-arabinose transferase-like glycosyltransferase
VNSRFGNREEVSPASFRSCLLIFLLVSTIAFPIVLGLGMTRGLSHDEHQHVAAGALIAREGLLPYRDFAHFHTPYLPFVYALIFRFTDHLLTSARLLSVFCATAILGVIGSIAYHLFRNRGRMFAIAVCFASVLLASMARLFTETSGHAWNHEPSLILVLFAFLALIAGVRSSSIGWLAASGALLGLGIGMRITYAPLVAPFGLALLLYPSSFQWRWGRVLSFGSGLLLGLAGIFCLSAAVPEQALFDNFGFAKANIDYRLSTGEPRTMTLPTKLRFFFKLIIRPNAALFLAGLVPVIAAFLANWNTGRSLRFELRLILLLLPFLLIGSFAPSPLFDQYFYPLVPFLLVAGLYGYASIPQESTWFRCTTLAAATCLILSVTMGFRGYEDFREFFIASEWHGMKLRKRVREIRTLPQEGKILTLAPIYPLEAGRSIYPSFSTGPIAWRVSPFIDPAKALRLGITTPATLENMLNAEPPAAVLVGFDKTGEELLLAYASQRGYARRFLPDKNQLWIRQPD